MEFAIVRMGIQMKKNYGFLVTSRTRRDDRAMRYIAVVLLVACGSTQPTPVQPVEERPADWWITKTPTAQDAGVAQTTPPADATEEAAPADAAVVEPTEADADPALPVGVTMEDGVRVVRTRERQWCATGGYMVGFCVTGQTDCQKRFKVGCRRQDNYACFAMKTRTSGRDSVLCLSSYALCEKASTFAATDDETLSTTDCTIMRYDPKAEK